MKYINPKVSRHWLFMVSAIAFVMLTTGCGGGGDSELSTPLISPVDEPAETATTEPEPTTDPDTNTDPASAPDPTTGSSENTFDVIPDNHAAARLLTQATFGPTTQTIADLQGNSISEWLLNQFEIPMSTHQDYTQKLEQQYGIRDSESFMNYNISTTAFWQHAITANDQLRQRVAFALSQILVVSNASDDFFEDNPIAISAFQDILIKHAFGNYSNLLKEVTYSPTMGRYLTYLGNEKANQETGRVPDENYAREILQLFSIGLIALNMDGSQQLDSDGKPIELYTNQDITGLAKVFTGLDLDYAREDDVDDKGAWGELFTVPMAVNPETHSNAEKTFLGLSIPANTDAKSSIDLALNHIMSQPSVAPFIARQLIQRLVTSHPEQDYIARVATAFETGSFELPNGSSVGNGQKGDLKATVSAILTDPDARFDMMPAQVDLTRFGKVREPLLRISHWARAFELSVIAPELVPALWHTAESSSLSQHPYRARSVFNFYRPGYVAPGSITGSLGLTMPELQIINASSTFGYANYLSGFALGLVQENPDEWAAELAEDPDELQIDLSNAGDAFLPTYRRELAFASSPSALVTHLENILFTGNLTPETSANVADTITLIPYESEDPDIANGQRRAEMAIIMLMTSPDYLVQR